MGVEFKFLVLILRKGAFFIFVYTSEARRKVTKRNSNTAEPGVARARNAYITFKTLCLGRLEVKSYVIKDQR